MKPMRDEMKEIRMARFRGTAKQRKWDQGVAKRELTGHWSTSGKVCPAWHWSTTCRATFAGVTAEFQLTRTFGFAHFILRDTLVIKPTITFGIRMNPIAFIDTYWSSFEREREDKLISFLRLGNLHWFLSARFIARDPQETRSYSMHWFLSASNNCRSGQFSRVRRPLSHW